MSAGISQAYAGPNLTEAERLIWQGKAEAAYNILQPYEFELSGDVKYDYLLGLAALESGRPDQATLAFERVLIQEPNYFGARLDLARAWFALNLFDLAREEFETLQGMDPPPAARKTINKYLELIEERTSRTKEGSEFGGYLEARIGRDSNVNAAPGNTNIYVPAFGGTITLNTSSIGTAANYLAMALGANGIYRNGSGISLTGGIEGVDRKLQTSKAFNTTDLKGYLGFTNELDKFAYSVGLQYSRMYLAGNSYRNTPSLGFDLRWALDSGNVLFLFGQHIRQRHSDVANRPNDADINLMGAGYAFAFGEKMETQSFISGYAGGDRAVAGRVDGNKSIYGLKAGLKHIINPELNANLNLGYQRGAYNTINSLFLVKRRDTITEASAGLIWQVAEPWSIRPSVSHFSSSSNIAIYNYKRTDAMLAVRYAF
ncbi:tetratricopeptide repeat protein [Pseudomonadota bacterium]